MQGWLDLGGISAKTLITSRFRLDGGTMFGPCPKPEWNRFAKADAQNRIPLVIRSLLLRQGDAVVLVEAGMGNLFTPAEARELGVTALSGDLATALAAEAIDPAEITHLILTHLHFDHVGGIALRDGAGVPRPLMPDARVYLQRAQWEKARAPGPGEAGSFRRADLRILEAMDLRLLEGPETILPGIQVGTSDGHTHGLQTVAVSGKRDRIYYPSDLIPLLAHVRTACTAAYDQWPERLVEEKLAYLADVVAHDGLLVFVHDPATVACRVRPGSGGCSVRCKESF